MADPVEIDRAAVRRARHGEPLPLLVLLHGYGSDERDLFSLVPFLPEGVAVASLPYEGLSMLPLATGSVWIVGGGRAESWLYRH